MENPEHEMIPEKRDYFSLPLEVYEKLLPAQLELIAQEAGVTVEKFKELISRAKLEKENDEEKKRKATLENREFQKTYQLIPEQVRVALTKMKATEGDLERAGYLESEAYKAFDTPGHSSEEVKKMFLSALTIRTSNRFYELCAGRSLENARELLEAEVKNKLSQTNIPELREATEEALNIFLASIKRLASPRKRFHDPDDSFGSAEKFGVDSSLNFPKHGRPRRLNDELEGW